ncbi:type VII secretion protein EccCa [Streptomyces sp. NPDC090080]|uniref:type VII secretion protein EccCa n=1 Tax=Streptomyces sp. NPDC090080 TaxID=3365939 RepID=UPI00380D4BEA
MPDGELTLQEPPVIGETVPGGAAGMLTYLPMGLMSGCMVLLYIRPGQTSSIMTYLILGVMGMAMGMMVLGQFLRSNSERKHKLKGARRDYLRYIAGLRRKVRAAVQQQQSASAWTHPGPSALASFARTGRLWERRPSDADFGEVRIAVGEQRLGLRLTTKSARPVEDLDPLTAQALRAFVAAYSTVPDQPISIFLPAWARILMRGDRDGILALARAMVTQMSVLHAPQDLILAFCLGPDQQAEWDWVKWLPHAVHVSDADAAGPARLISQTAGDLFELLGTEFGERPSFEARATSSSDEPLTVIIIDGGQVPPAQVVNRAGLRNCVVVDLSGSLPWKPGRTVLRLELSEGQVSVIRTDRNRKENTTVLGRADRLGPAAADAIARVLTPIRTGATAETSQPLTTDTQLTSLLGITDLTTFDPKSYWEQRLSPSSRLRVPIAIGADGRPVHLDIKESAENGMGPHGMLIGATGSGKSELLRTLVLGLALTHSSDSLNFVLVDFKGGATFLGLDELPHTSAVITNLADEAALVSRMQDALHGELIRRQELLRAAGNYSSALEYERARANGAHLAPLPSLFVVVDEFSELLSAHREFMDLFVMIGRLGRSLGVHLLLASQRLDEGRMHQLESHLSYRIGLRTFSAMESRGVLGVPDAYELPPQPGAGYLKSGTQQLTRFRAAYVSGAYERTDRAMVQARAASQIVPWTIGRVEPRDMPDTSSAQKVKADTTEAEQSTLLATAIDRLRDSGSPAHQVWLPPLSTPPTLDELLPPLSAGPGFGLTTRGWSGRGALRVPVGLIDLPFEQRRELLTIDVSGAGGNIAIAGGPQSGKSTLLRTVVSALALTHTPHEVQFYCLDFGGGSLSSLRGLPHVGSVSGRLDTERVGRTLAEINALLVHRERLFAENGIESMADLRRRRADGEFPDEPHGDVFLVIDGWATLREEFLNDIPAINQITARGLNYGIHLVTTAARWVELSAPVRDQAGTKLELRMGDAFDSIVDGRRAKEVPRIAGRGLTADTKMHYIAALPRIDGQAGASDLAAGVADMVTSLSESWRGDGAPAVRMLPTSLPASSLPVISRSSGIRIPLGVEEKQLDTAWVNFAETPHLVAFGDNESGKTNLLKLVARSVMQAFSPDEAKILVVDFRRTLAEVVPESYRLGHAISSDQLRDLLRGVGRALTTRQPGADISPARMRKADWWSGPRLFILIDDYDLLGPAGMNSPFEPLMEHLPLGYEVGLHIVLTRSAGGAMRGVNDPLIRRLLEMNAPGFLMSCPPSEGIVFGNVKPRILPPGRGMMITRRSTVLIHTALAD